MSRVSFVAVILTVTLPLSGIASPSNAEDSALTPANEKQPESPELGTAEYIQRALGKTVDLTVMDVSLEAVVKDLGKQASLTIQIDEGVLDEAGLRAADLKVSKALKGLSLRSVLRNVLRDFDLTYMYYEGVLMITTPEEAESNLVTTIYEVVDLIGRDDARPEKYDYDALIELITSTVHPESWDEVGGPGSISGYRGTLVMSQTVEVHEDVAHLFAAARKAIRIAGEHRDKAPPVVSVPLTAFGKGDENAAIEEALDKVVEFEFKEVPLDKVIGTLNKDFKNAIDISKGSLEDIGLAIDTPITVSANSLKLRQALRLMLRDLHLTFRANDGVLTITTAEDSQQNLITRAYPILDLVEVESAAFGLPVDPRSPRYDYDSLIELTTSSVAPDTWDEVGGPGSLAVMDAYGVLVISQTYKVHEQIENFYTALRRTIPEKAKRVVKQVDDGQVRLAVYIVPSYGPKEQKPRTNQVNEDAEAKKALPQFGGGGLGGGGFGGGGMASGTTAVFGPAPDEEEMLELITSLIEPESWRTRDDVFARAVTGRLVIRHTESIHRQIKELAARLGVADFREVPNWPATPGQMQGGFF